MVCLSLISRVKETIWEIKEKKRNFLWSLPPHSHSRAFKSPLTQIAMGGRRHNSPLLRQKTSLFLPQQKFFFVFQTRGRYFEFLLSCTQTPPRVKSVQLRILRFSSLFNLWSFRHRLYRARILQKRKKNRIKNFFVNFKNGWI